MGVNAGLYIIPARKFITAKTKGTWDRHRWDKCRPWFDLDKAWRQIGEVLKDRSDALGYAIDGDVRVCPNEPGFNFVSPPVVARIARELTDIPTAEILDDIEREF